jgi:hypothetical protein
MFLIRLDDACEYRDTIKWDRIEKLLDSYSIKPIVAVIPECCDSDFLSHYLKDEKFWEKVNLWSKKGWTIALHGLKHQFHNCDGGLNPVNKYSEFSGLDLESQKRKIREGIKKCKNYGISPSIFVAPAHTFDNNTLEALRSESNIRVINDTIASSIYFSCGFFFLPQQAGSVRYLPLKFVTFCYHPNTMDNNSFIKLEKFIKNNKKKFISYSDVVLVKRKYSLFDTILSRMYFNKVKRNNGRVS